MNVVQQTMLEALADHGERTMAADGAPRCIHVKANGVRCGSPALRDRERCYFHHRQDCPPIMHGLHLMEDANGVQCALMQIADMIVQKTLEHKTAKLLLYALQIASSNVKNVRFERCGTMVTEEPQAKS
jgi:hypothetical protein